MNKINYQKLLDKELEKIQATGTTPTLLLHSCCAPCSSYVIEYLSKYFKITVFITTPTFHPMKNTDTESKSRSDLSKVCHLKTK